jgi:hypothetical protein
VGRRSAHGPYQIVVCEARVCGLEQAKIAMVFACKGGQERQVLPARGTP